MTESSQGVSSELMGRLSYVRYLYDMGVEQSLRPEPMSSAALLTLHDAAEMLLQIAVEYRKAASTNKNPGFFDLWKDLEKTGVVLSNRTAMERFNAARVGLKHKGIRPAHSEIEGFRAAVTNFMLDTSRTALDLDFNHLRLTLLIADEEVRGFLEKSQDALANGDMAEALDAAACAFHRAIRGYERRDRRLSLRSEGYNLRNLFRGSLLTADPNVPRQVSELLKDANDVSNQLAEAITIVGYNLDFEGYLLFKTHAPNVFEATSGRLQTNRSSVPRVETVVVERCIAFVVDTVIRLQSSI